MHPHAPRLAAASIVTALAACGGGDGAPAPDAGDHPTEAREGCDGATLRGTSTDPAARGPWDVGARTVRIGRLTVEVWYPAPPGSAAGREPARYDLREALSPALRGVIPDDDNPWQPCDCHRDLPLDEAHGPYPAVVFVHGTASFRHQSLTHVTHWASRGFVVVAADHPGLLLGDLLARFCGDQASGEQDLAGDVDALLAAIAAPAGDLAFLAGRVDAGRVAVSGHSAGGAAAAAAAGRPGVRVVMPMAATAATAPAAGLERVLYLGGRADTIAAWSRVEQAWQGSATPRHLIGIDQTGHLFCSDLCDTRNAEGQDLVEIAREHALCGSDFASLLFDCDPGYLDGDRGRRIVDHATATVLEATLQCRDDLAPLDAIGARYPEIGVYAEAL